MKVTIKTTFGEILNQGNWDRFCDLKGINEWCINEGLANSDEKVELTIEEAKQVGILPSDFFG